MGTWTLYFWLIVDVNKTPIHLASFFGSIFISCWIFPVFFVLHSVIDVYSRRSVHFTILCSMTFLIARIFAWKILQLLFIYLEWVSGIQDLAEETLQLFHFPSLNNRYRRYTVTGWVATESEIPVSRCLVAWSSTALIKKHWFWTRLLSFPPDLEIEKRTGSISQVAARRLLRCKRKKKNKIKNLV